MSSKEIPATLYDEIREKILEIISRMDLSRQTKLMSEKQLAAKLMVSRSSVRIVLNDLETEGKLIRKQGSGTYVNTRAFNMNATLYPYVSLRTIIEKNGYTVTARNLSVTHIEAGKYAVYLNCRPSEEVLEVHSLYLADDKPCMYCIDRAFPNVLMDEEWKDSVVLSQSLYTSIRDFGSINITWDVIRIRSVNCDDIPEISKVMKKDRSANRSLTVLEIINYDDMSHPIIHGTIYVNTDLIRLDLVRNISKLP